MRLPNLALLIAPAPAVAQRRRTIALVLVAVVVALITFVVVLLSTGGEAGPATGAAALVPADALAYVHLSTDASRPAVVRAENLAGRFPDHLLPGTALIARLSAVASGGTTVDFATDIRPWLGREAAVAVLNGAGAGSGTLIVLDAARPARARAFVRQAGAVAGGRLGGATLYRYADGTEAAFAGHYVVFGTDAGVRASLAAFTGRAPSLAGRGVYQRAAAGEPADRVLDAYVSAAGVGRVLLARHGIPASLGVLLEREGAAGATISVSPAAGGDIARVQLHSALARPSGGGAAAAGASASAAAGTGAGAGMGASAGAGAGMGAGAGAGAGGEFTPTLADLVPAHAILMLDVPRLDRAAPAVLAAAAQAGIGAGIAPLLSRLGAALGAEGVDVRGVQGLFDHEGVVAIGPSRSLIVLARVPSQETAAMILAELEGPLAQLFPPPASGPGQAPEFGDRQVAGITAHQLSLAPGLQLDYAVFDGLVAVSTSLSAIEDVAGRAGSLTREASYAATLGDRPAQVASLGFFDFTQLLSLGAQIGLTRSAAYAELQPDLQKIRAVGMVSTRGEDDITTELSLQIP